MTVAVTPQTQAPKAQHKAARSSEPTRRCIVSRQPRPRFGLIRFVLDPDRNVVPDLAETLPGRGFWLSADREIVEKACSTNAFAKAARGSVTIPENLLQTLESLLLTRCMRWLGLARSAGQLQSGFFQCREALARQQVAVLIEASDAAPNGKAKLSGMARGLARVECFPAEKLGEALGRDHLVHLALAPGKLSGRFLADAHRYAGLIGSRLQSLDGEQ